jgi:hypothetical protein
MMRGGRGGEVARNTKALFNQSVYTDIYGFITYIFICKNVSEPGKVF